MNEELITYKKFNDLALANDLAETLQKHNINYRVEEESTLFNPSFYTDELAKDYAVKINADDFITVNGILKAEEKERINTVNSDHYLYDFTDVELMDLISKPDEWSPFDCQLATKILNERGVDVNDEKLAELNEKRLEELKKPESTQTWITFGYLFALLGGVLGVFIGWHLANYKKTLPNGEVIYGYTQPDRAHGKRIFYLSIIILIVVSIFRIMRNTD
jgi:hypothetical protein